MLASLSSRLESRSTGRSQKNNVAPDNRSGTDGVPPRVTLQLEMTRANYIARGTEWTPILVEPCTVNSNV